MPSACPSSFMSSGRATTDGRGPHFTRVSGGRSCASHLCSWPGGGDWDSCSVENCANSDGDSDGNSNSIPLSETIGCKSSKGARLRSFSLSSKSSSDLAVAIHHPRQSSRHHPHHLIRSRHRPARRRCLHRYRPCHPARRRRLHHHHRRHRHHPLRRQPHRRESWEADRIPKFPKQRNDHWRSLPLESSLENRHHCVKIHRCSRRPSHSRPAHQLAARRTRPPPLLQLPWRPPLPPWFPQVGPAHHARTILQCLTLTPSHRFSSALTTTSQILLR